MNTSEWISLAMAALALLLSVTALVVALNPARRRRAAETVPEALVVADVVESPPAAPPLPVGVAWKIEHEAGITWRLRNIGTEPAYDVNAVGLPPESASLVKMRDSFADVPAHGSLGFNVVRTAHHPNFRGLAITWNGQTEPVIVTID